MSRRPLIVLTLLGSVLVLSCVHQVAAQTKPTAGVAKPDAEASATRPPIEGLSLQHQMVLIQAALSRVATDASAEGRREAALEGIEELQKRIIEAKKAKPPRFGELSAEAQRAHDTAFRSSLARMLVESATLEIAVLDAQSEQVHASLERLAGTREDGHAQFQPPRERVERAAVDLQDEVEVTATERALYVGAYEFPDVGFRMTIVDQEGVLYVETFGQPAERLYSLGEHAFRVAPAPNAVIRFEFGEEGAAAAAIILDPGRGQAPRRIERVRDS